MPSIPVSLVAEPDDPFSIQPIAEGKVGADPVRFVIDTGARTCLVPLTPATPQLTVLGPATGTGAANVISGDDEVIVSELRVGNLIAHDVHADRADLRPPRHPLLGMNVLGEFRCLFRFMAGVIELDVPEPSGVDGHDLDLDDAGQPYVPVTFGSVDVRSCWDTGASLSVVDLCWANRHPHLVSRGARTTGHDSAGVAVATWKAELAPCSIGGVVFSASPCVAIDLAPLNAKLARPLDVIVGMPLIQTADWWFDFPGRRWTVAR